MRAATVFDPSLELGANGNMVDLEMHPREGDERLSESNKIGPRSKGGRDRPRRRPGRKRGDASDVGRALRSVYDSTLREEVPTDFLDLLGKLD